MREKGTPMERDEAEFDSATDTLAEFLHECGFAAVYAERIARAVARLSREEED